MLIYRKNSVSVPSGVIFRPKKAVGRMQRNVLSGTLFSATVSV